MEQDGPRSYESLLLSDLLHLAELAEADLDGFISRNHRTHGALRERLLCILLCQGAALHYVDGINGVKDFDVWFFFAGKGIDREYPARRRGYAQFANGKFKNSTMRVDFMGRSLKASLPGDDPAGSIQAYLTDRPTGSARHLAKKAAVMLWPSLHLGEVIWPMPIGNATVTTSVLDA